MSLKLKKVSTFKSRVTVQQPGDNPERPSEATFVAEFKYLDRDAFDALMASSPSDAEFLDTVLVGATEISDESGAPAPFEAAKAAIAGDLSLSAATVRAFMEAISGAREKNSLRSRAR